MLQRSALMTSHAARRMAQRNISPDEAALVICYGAVEHRSGVEFYFLRRRDIPSGRERDFERLVGTTVVVRRGRIKTVYKNRRALPNIRRKSKLHRSTRVSTVTSLSGSDLPLNGMSGANGGLL